MRDVSDEIAALHKRLSEAAGYLKIDEARARRPQLETEASRPDLWDDPDRARLVTGELASVTDDLEACAPRAERIDDAETLAELAAEEHDDSVAAEIEANLTGLAGDFSNLEL